VNHWKNFIRRVLAIICGISGVIWIGVIGLPDRAMVTAIGYVNGNPISPEIGGIAPSLSLTALNGSPYPFHPGRPTVLNFWATWCAPCIAEMPLLEKTARRYPSLQLITVNLGESANDVESWLATHLPDRTLGVALDPDQRTYQRYRVRGVPATYFIDSNGKIQLIRYGAISEPAIEAGVQQLTASR
jgi:thiol-disulfide isomerase/thioredoxin